MKRNRFHRSNLTALVRLLRCRALGKETPRSLSLAHSSLGGAIDSLSWGDGLRGFAVAEKRTDGVTTGELAIRFYVARKIAKDRLKTAQLIPESLSVQTATAKAPLRIACDVVEMRQIPVVNRQVNAGDSISHQTAPFGTLGLVVSGPSGGKFILTCAHVAAPPSAAVGDREDSPSDSDNGPFAGSEAGTLYAWTVLDNENDNTVDGALIEPTPDIQLTNAKLRLGDQPSWAAGTAILNRSVSCYSVFGEKRGVIDSIQNHFSVQTDNGIFFFSDIGAYSVNATGGDSGAAVVDCQNRQVYGIHFAGLSDSNLGYFIMGRNIAKLWNVSVYPG